MADQLNAIENADGDEPGSIVFNREQVQEQEQEQEAGTGARAKQEQEGWSQILFARSTIAKTKQQSLGILQLLQIDPIRVSMDSILYLNSQFTENARISPKPLKSFPDYLVVSSNYFRRGWSKMRFHRRIKNIIMCLDWIRMSKCLR